MSIDEQQQDASPPPEYTGEVWPPPPTGQFQGPSFDGLQFKSQNVLVLLLLTVITLNIYTLFWMYRQIKTINTRVSPAPISLIPFWMCVALYVADLVVAVALPNSTHLSNPIELVSNLMWIFMMFTIRGGLNLAFGARSGDPDFCQKVWTFFLNDLYLQHRINKYQQSQGRV